MTDDISQRSEVGPALSSVLRTSDMVDREVVLDLASGYTLVSVQERPYPILMGPLG